MENPVDYFIERVQNYQTPLGDLSVRKIPESNSLQVILVLRWREKCLIFNRTLDQASLAGRTEDIVAWWAFNSAHQVLTEALTSVMRICDGLNGMGGVTMNKEILEQIVGEVPKYSTRRVDEGGLHGLAHMRRTAIIAEMIWRALPPNPVARRRPIPPWVVVAAVLHDIGRVDDGEDREHGLRGVSPAVMLMEYLGWYTDLEVGCACEAIIAHCQVGPGTGTYIQVVKDADKLERYRLGDHSGPDPNRLALQVSRDLMLDVKAFILQDLAEEKHDPTQQKER